MLKINKKMHVIWKFRKSLRVGTGHGVWKTQFFPIVFWSETGFGNFFERMIKNVFFQSANVSKLVNLLKQFCNYRQNNLNLLKNRTNSFAVLNFNSTFYIRKLIIDLLIKTKFMYEENAGNYSAFILTLPLTKQ